MLKEAGHEVTVLSTKKAIGHTWNGILHLPGGNRDYAVEGMLNWPSRFDIDVIVTLFDIWPLPEDIGSQLNMMGVKWIPMAPIDHDPMPQKVLKRLLHAPYCIAMSRFAERQMKDRGLDPVYIPHGVDTEIFKPGEGRKNRVTGTDENVFLVGNIATNLEPLDRKGFWPTIEAFGKFHAKHPDSVLYCHTNPTRTGGGLDISGMAEMCGFQIHTPDPWYFAAGVPDGLMAQFYNSFDVYMMLTRGEGFGVPLIEAQACGKPVIVTDFTAPSDLVGAGWKIPIAGKRMTTLNSYWAEPDVEAAVDALEEAYDLWKSGKIRERFEGDAVEFAKQFDFAIIRDRHLLPFFERVENEIKEEKARDERARQKASQQQRQISRVHDRQLGKKNSKRSKRRRKKR